MNCSVFCILFCSPDAQCEVVVLNSIDPDDITCTIEEVCKKNIYLKGMKMFSLVALLYSETYRSHNIKNDVRNNLDG